MNRLTQEAHSRLKQELDELIAHRQELAANIDMSREDAVRYQTSREEQVREEIRIRYIEDLLRVAQIAMPRSEEQGKVPTFRDEDETYLPAARGVGDGEAPTGDSPRPVERRAFGTDEGKSWPLEVSEEVTIYEAYRGLDDYIAEQENAFDISVGLTRLFAGMNYMLPSVQSASGSANAAFESESRSPLPARALGTSASSGVGARAMNFGEQMLALAAGQMSVRKSKTGRTQQERSDAVRRRLLDATVDCLVRYGYAGTTTTRVTELAGVTRGAQVHHFPTRADLVAAAVRHLAAKRAELAFERIDEVRQAADPLDAALDLLWEIHQGPINYATIEMWVAARTDPELREQLTRVEPTARASVIEFAEAAFGDYATNPRFRYLMYTAMDAIRGILLMGLSDEDSTNSLKRWRRAKADFRELMNAVQHAP